MAAFWARGRNDQDNQPQNSVGQTQAVLAATWQSPGGDDRLTLVGTFISRHKRLDESRGPLFEAPDTPFST